MNQSLSGKLLHGTQMFLLVVALSGCGGSSDSQEAQISDQISNEIGAALPVQATDLPENRADNFEVPGADVANAVSQSESDSNADRVFTVTAEGPLCDVDSLSSLQMCMSNATNFAGIKLTSDLSCSGSDCCRSGAPLIDIRNLEDFYIEGQGHQLLRGDNQKQCSAINVNASQNIHIRNLTLDEDINDEGCFVGQNCPRTINVLNSSDVVMDNIHVLNSKAYSVYTNGVDTFRFINSSIRNAGILGLYVGHADNYSSNVLIENSEFIDIQTNAIALLGVAGANTNIVRNNKLLRNHWSGHWEVAPQFGTGKTGGGQLYIARANNVQITDNIISDGYCVNCLVTDFNRSSIHGIELGEPNRPSISNVTVESNLISNNDSTGIFLNANSPIDSSIVVRNNTFINNSFSVHNRLADTNATIDNNDERATAIFESFESPDALVNEFTVVEHCATSSSATRSCDSHNRHGQCALTLQLGTPNCMDANVSIFSDWHPIVENQLVSTSGWLRDGAGDWCIEFSDIDRDVIGTTCEPITPNLAAAQGFIGAPILDVSPAPGSHFARLLIRNRSQQPMIVDDVKISGVR